VPNNKPQPTDEAMIAIERYDADFKRRIAALDQRLKALEDREKAKRVESGKLGADRPQAIKPAPKVRDQAANR
jgi:hypothetical protein